MPNITSAKKRARQNIKRRAHRAAKRSEVRSSIKRVIRLANERQKEKAVVAYRQAQSLMDRSLSKNLFPKNKMARLKSRLMRRLNAADS